MAMLSRATSLPLRNPGTYANVWRSLLQQWRGLSSGTSGKDSNADRSPEKSGEQDRKDDQGDDDGFGMGDFLVHEEEEVAVTVEDTMKEIEDKDVTPEIASELVNRMVDATARSLEKRTSIHGNVLSSLSPHTISVLHASRINTNTVHASGTETDKYPIEKRVTAELHIDQLNLSAPARQALLLLSKGRLRNCYKFVYVSCDRFPSKEENRAHIVTKLHRLVLAAKSAVGEEVDLTPLKTWDDIVEEVERQAGKDIAEAGGVHNLLGEAKL